MLRHEDIHVILKGILNFTAA